MSRNGGDQAGDNLRETSYTANRLNQYSSRTTPYSADVIGMARGSAVTVKLNGTSVGAPYRKGEYFGKKVYSASTGGTLILQEKYLYDGWNLVAVLDGANLLQKSFLWGTDLSGSMQGAGGVGGLIAFTKHAAPSTGTWFAAFDGNGNLGALVSAADGSVQATYEYGPFGEVIRATGANAKANPFRFSTKFQDDEIDLVYYGYRFYSAATGRWISRDPIGERGGLNLSCLLGNDPVRFFDPSGLFRSSSGCNASELVVLRAAEKTALARAEEAIRLLNSDWSMTQLSRTDPAFSTAYSLSAGFREDYRLWNLVMTQTLQGIVDGIKANRYSVECECTCWGWPGTTTEAYSHDPRGLSPFSSDVVHFCPLYFAGSSGNQVGVLLHELSHVFSDTDDLVLGGMRPWVDNAIDAHFLNGLGINGPESWFGTFLYKFVRLYP